MTGTRRTAAMMAALGVSAWGAEAQAYDVLAEPCLELPLRCATAPLTFDEKDALPIEWSFDTGWVPPGSPLQVHLEAFVAAHTRVALQGALITQWPHPSLSSTLLLATPGAAGGGLLSFHYGLFVNAEGKIDIDVGLLNFTWQGDLPYLPQIDFQVFDDVGFDAWGWPPGVSASASTEVVTLAQIDIANLIGLDIPGIEGGFELDVALDVDVTWVAERLVIQTSDGEPVAGGDVTAPNDNTFADYLGGAYAELAVHPEGTVHYDGVIHLIPAFYVSLLGNDWTIPIADIPIAFPITDVDWVFEPQWVHVPLPDLVVEDEVVDFGELRVGEEAYRYYSLRNDGEALAAAILSTGAPDTFPLWDHAIAIPAEESSLASVRFTPHETGLHETELVIASNDPDAPTQTLLLRGFALPRRLHRIAIPAAAGTHVTDEGGCGCRLGGADGEHRAGWSLILALALLGRRVSRRQVPSGTTPRCARARRRSRAIHTFG